MNTSKPNRYEKSVKYSVNIQLQVFSHLSLPSLLKPFHKVL